MNTMVQMIEMTKENITELEALIKEVDKRIAEATEEKQNAQKNLVMFNRVLEDLTGIRDEEIEIVMAEKPKQEIKPVETKTEKKVETEKKNPVRKGRGKEIAVWAIDEHGERIAEYKSTALAGKDLKICPGTVRWRLTNMPVETQIQRNGYALVAAGA